MSVTDCPPTGWVTTRTPSENEAEIPVACDEKLKPVCNAEFTDVDKLKENVPFRIIGLVTLVKGVVESFKKLQVTGAELVP